MSASKLLILPGSTRAGSINTRLAAVMAAACDAAGAEVTRISLADYPMPVYDGDLEARSGVPVEARALDAMIARHDGLVIVSPEYNASIPPLLKNAIDWVSRLRDADGQAAHAWRGRIVALASASTGRHGGARCLAHLRLVLTNCGAVTLPSQLSLSFADDAYDDRERLKHAGDVAALETLTRQLIDFAQQMR